MSLKDNVEAIKEELSAEEKFLESAIKTERFFTKYKKYIITIGVVIVLFAFGKLGYDIKEQSRIEKANTALDTLMKNPNDKQALKTLKDSSEKLYMLYVYYKALNDNDTDKLEEISKKKLQVVSDLSSYEVASRTSSASKLDSYALKPEAMYKDLAIFESAYIDLKRGDVKKCKQKLSKISDASSLKKFAQVLNHYGIK